MPFNMKRKMNEVVDFDDDAASRPVFRPRIIKCSRRTIIHETVEIQMVYWQEQQEETYTAESSEMEWASDYDEEEVSSSGNDAMDWSPCTEDLIQQMSRLSLTQNDEEDEISQFLMDWSPCIEDENLIAYDVEPMDWTRQ